MDNKEKINLPMPNLLGDFQISNVCAAISTVRNLPQFKISKSHIVKAITKIKSEGRLQVIKKGKLTKHISRKNKILIDGAHNTLAALAINSYLKNFYKNKKIVMVLGMMANKEHKKFIQIFKKRVNSIITLDIPNQENFIGKAKLLKIAQNCGIPAQTANSIKSALKKIKNENDDSIIFFAGSLYFAGEVLNLN